MINRKSILIIVGDPVGGIRRHVHDIIFNVSNDFKIHYVSSSVVDSKFSNDSQLFSSHNISHYKLNIKKQPSFWDLINIFKIYLLIKKHNIKMVHGHGAKGGLYSRIAGKLAGCKVVYTPHGGVLHPVFDTYRSNLYISIEKVLVKFTDTLLLESDYSADRFRSLISKNADILVNKNALNINSHSLSNTPLKRPHSDSKHIGIFALMREEKGHLVAFTAISSLLDEGYDIYLHFFGEGPLLSTLKNQANASAFSDKFVFHGDVPDVYDYMNSVDFVLVPSLHESFGYTALEALLLRKPLISSRSGGLDEIVSVKSTFTFVHSIPNSINQAIKRALDADEQLLKDMSEVGFEDVSFRFSFSQMISNIKRIYSLHL